MLTEHDYSQLGEAVHVVEGDRQDAVRLVSPPRNSYEVAPIRRMPIKTKQVELDGDYAGWTLRARTNMPIGTLLEMTSLDDKGMAGFERVIALLPELIVSWNFVDTQAQPLPCDISGVRQLPQDLLMQVLQKITSADTADASIPKE